MSQPSNQHGKTIGSLRRLWLRLKTFPRLLFLLASGALLALHWCAASSEKFLQEGDAHAGRFALVSLALFLVLSLAAYWTRHTFHGARSIAHHPSEEHPKTSLVFCVSAQPLELDPQNDGTLLLRVKGKDGRETRQLRLERKDQHLDGRTIPAIRADIEKLDDLGFFWSWQQLLRGLEPHVKTVRHIHLIGSEGTEGSHRQLADCRRLLAGYVNSDKVKIHTQHPPQNFENFKQLADLFDQIVRQDHQSGVPERDIAIDITGGLKPVSVAGAMATLNNDVAVQYVQTNAPKQEPIRKGIWLWRLQFQTIKYSWCFL